MARIFNEAEYAARRKEILDAALRLVYTKGFDRMTIQDILDDLRISKGAFYHYFESKAAVLEALTERMVVEETLPLLAAVVEQPGLSAIEKLERYFDVGQRWKSGRKDLMLSLLRVWVADENAIFRQKMLAFQTQSATPLLAEILRQGVREGLFNTDYPEQACLVIVYILQGLSETLIGLLLTREGDRDPARLERDVTTYANALTDAIERVLGARHGSLHLVDVPALMDWFSREQPADHREAGGV